MSLGNILAEDRRLVILRVLSEGGYVANESVLRKSLAAFGHQVGSDIVRADLTFLAEHDLVRIETLHPPSGELWLIHLKSAGEEVAQGRQHPGVARRGPGE
jgi:hypothetical protein